jgi:6-pyruvoyltetrahydropterin/6-carboxytetrahydropterin synthase
MRYSVGVTATFEAAHRLRGDFGPATRLHGHTYRLEVEVGGDALGEDGALCDVGRLQQAVESVTTELHYHDLDDVPGLGGRNTTMEAMAAYVFERVQPAVAALGLDRLMVKLWESPTAYAVCEGAAERKI